MRYTALIWATLWMGLLPIFSTTKDVPETHPCHIDCVVENGKACCEMCCNKNESTSADSGQESKEETSPRGCCIIPMNHEKSRLERSNCWECGGTPQKTPSNECELIAGSLNVLDMLSNCRTLVNKRSANNDTKDDLLLKITVSGDGENKPLLTVISRRKEPKTKDDPPEKESKMKVQTFRLSLEMFRFVQDLLKIIENKDENEGEKKQKEEEKERKQKEEEKMNKNRCVVVNCKRRNNIRDPPQNANRASLDENDPRSYLPLCCPLPCLNAQPRQQCKNTQTNQRHYYTPQPVTMLPLSCYNQVFPQESHESVDFSDKDYYSPRSHEENTCPEHYIAPQFSQRDLTCLPCCDQNNFLGPHRSRYHPIKARNVCTNENFALRNFDCSLGNV